MDTIAVSEKDALDFISSRKEPAWMQAVRSDAFRKMNQSKFPTFKYGLSIQIKPMVSLEFIPMDHGAAISVPTGSGCEIHSTISMGDDRFRPFFDGWPLDDDRLTLAHQAFANDFLLIRIPPGAKKDTSIDLSSLSSTGALISTVLIHAGAGSSAKIVLCREGNSLLSEEIRVIAEDTASIELVGVQAMSSGSAVMQRKIGKIGAGARCKFTDAVLGGRYCRMSVHNELVGKGASANILVVSYGKSDQAIDLCTVSRHLAPDTISDILTRSVVDDQAKTLSRGLVYIGTDAPRSNGYEKQDILILSDQAEADAIPDLKILNHDVRCTHGSTIGQLDKEKVFYLQSRGLSRKDAVSKIVEGYFMPVLDQAGDKHLISRMLAGVGGGA